MQNSQNKVRKNSNDASLSQSSSRIFTSRMRSQKDEGALEEVHENYTNGNQYKGTKKNGQRHGKGRYTFKDGSYY